MGEKKDGWDRLGRYGIQLGFSYYPPKDGSMQLRVIKRHKLFSRAIVVMNPDDKNLDHPLIFP